MSKLSITRDESGELVFSMTQLTGSKADQQQEFVDFFNDVEDMIYAIKHDIDNLEVVNLDGNGKPVVRNEDS